jgi:hypothetical protein
MPAAVVAVSTIMFFLLTFSRQNLMFMLVPFAWYLLYRYRSRSSRFALVLFGFCAYQFTVLLLLIRYYGSFLSAFDAFASGELFADFWFRLLSEGGEVELRLVYYFFVGGEYRSDVFPGQTYLRLLMLPLPAELSLGLKPGLTDINLFYLFFDEPVYSTVLGGSLHALVFGDSFVNFGWAGVAVGAFWGAAASAYQRLSAKLPVVLRIAMIAPLGFGAMMIARGSIYNSSAYIFWSFVLLCTMYVAAEIIGRLFGPARVDASAPRPA